MAFYLQPRRAVFVTVLCFATGIDVRAQSGNSTSVGGTVLDPSGAVVPNSTVEIRNHVSRFGQTTTTSDTGGFEIPNVPFNPYHLTVTAPGFGNYVQNVDVRSTVPILSSCDSDDFQAADSGDTCGTQLGA